jgi:ElaB protein
MEAFGSTSVPGTDRNNPVTRGIEQAGTGAHKAIDKVSDAARPAVDRMASGAHQAVDKAAAAAHQAADTLETKGNEIKEAQARLMSECSSYVRANPVMSLGIAVAAGFLLSRLLASR